MPELYRVIDGMRVRIPDDEAATIEAEWAANAAVVAPRLIDVSTLRERLETLGKLDAVAALLTPAQMLKLLTLREGVNLSDPAVQQLLRAAGVDVGALT